MNIGIVSLFLCALTTKCVIGQVVTIDPTANVGRYSQIGPNVRIEANAGVSDFVNIAADSSVGANSRINRYSNLGERVTIGSNVTIDSYTTLSNRVQIAPHSYLSDYVSVGENTNIGSKVRVNRYSTIRGNIEIGDECVLDEYSSVDSGTKIRANAYIGAYATLRTNAAVNEWAVIHKYVEIANGETIAKNEVVINTASSYDLYQTCASIEQIDPQDISIVSDVNRLADQNTLLLRLLNSQINDLTANCGRVYQLERIPIIKTLYLIYYHGRDNFNKNLQEIRSNSGSFTFSQNTVNGVSTTDCSPSMKLKEEFENEFHFVDSSAKRLEPNAEKLFIQLLALEQDIQRRLRVEKDTFCSMIQQIRNGERQIKTIKRKTNVNCGTDNETSPGIAARGGVVLSADSNVSIILFTLLGTYVLVRSS